MSKRKSSEIARQERGLGRQSLRNGRGSEDEEEAGSALSGSGKEDLDDLQELDEEFSGGEDDLDEELELPDEFSGEEEDIEQKQGLDAEFSGGEDDDDAVGDDEEERQLDAEDSTAFGRAFAKIMKKRIPQSAFTEVSGPVLAERKQLLVKKFEEADIEGKTKTTGKEEKREVREKGHVLPQTYVDAKEKALIKLATKGVVRLFNAVSKAQKVQADSDISSSKAAKATWKQSKAAFMTELRGSSNSVLTGNQADEIPLPHERKEPEPEPGWAALRKDFMLGTSNKLVDWDKKLPGSMSN